MLTDTHIHSPCPLIFLPTLRAPPGTPQKAHVCIYFFICPFHLNAARRARGDWQAAHSLPTSRAGRQPGLWESEGSGTPEESNSAGFPPAEMWDPASPGAVSCTRSNTDTWDTSACCRAYPLHIPRWVPGTGKLWLQDSKGDAALPFHHSLQTASQPDHSVCNGVMCTSVILGRIRTVVVGCTEKGRPSSTSVASRGRYGSLTIL